MNELKELQTDEMAAIEGGLGVVGFVAGMGVVAGGAFAIGYVAGYAAAR